MKLLRIFLSFMLYCTCFLYGTVYGQGHIVSAVLGIEDGVPHSDVTSVTQDAFGFIWFGTPNGVCRWDGTELLSVNEFKGDKWDILRNAKINDMTAARDSVLYIACHEAGLTIFDIVSHKTATITADAGGRRLPNINRICECDSGRIFLCTAAGLYEYREGEGVLPSGFSEAVCDMAEESDSTFILLSDRNAVRYNVSDGTAETIIGGSFTDITDSGPGVFCIVGTSGQYLYDSYEGTAERVSAAGATAVEKDSFGNIWVGTGRNGIMLYSPSMEFIRSYTDKDRITRLPNNLIKTLYADNVGNLWVGTMEGLVQIVLNVNDFQLYDNLSYHYSGKRIKGICEYDGNVIMSLPDAGLDMWTDDFSGMVSLSDYIDNLPSGMPVLRRAINGDLLLGGSGGVYVLSRNDMERVLAHREHVRIRSIFNKAYKVNLILEDRETGLWVGTDRGLFNVKFEGDMASNRYYTGAAASPVRYFDNSAILSALVDRCDTTDRKRIWVGCRDGLKTIDFTENGETVADWSEESTDPYFRTIITSIIKGKNGEIAMLSINRGLDIIPPEEKWSYGFRGEKVENESIRSVYETLLQDNSGNYWIGGIGLLKWSPETSDFRYYDTGDGLVNGSFKVRTACRLSSGIMMMAGLNSIDVFDPETIKDYTAINANAVFSRFRVSGTDVIPGQEYRGKVIMQESISNTSSVVLSHYQNDFSISFNVLDYSGEHYYRYMLKGEDDGFTFCTGSGNEASYSNLAPGKYEFTVYYTDNNLIWKYDPLVLHIRIKPPFYATTAALVLYLILAASALYYAQNAYRKRLKQRNAVLLADAIRMEEKKLDGMKLRFYADISHEIKTPLTLIYSPICEICSGGEYDSGEVRRKLMTARKNVERLKYLAESLIDMEGKSREYSHLIVTKVDAVSFCREITDLFSDLARIRGIDYSFEPSADSVTAYFDTVKIEKVLFNLIGNAFKYTEENGKIKVSLRETEENLEICVEDNGAGIPEGNREKIFERYYRSLNTGKPGSGIGLSLSDTIIKKHGGTLRVESEEGKGSRFTVSLLKGCSHYDKGCIVGAGSDTVRMPLHEETGFSVKGDMGKRILVVDDNSDMREYLKNSLGRYYTVLEANDGKEALGIALSEDPDMVISDVLMPEMDGFRLCEELKSNIRTSHIPVLLISAQSSSYMAIKGYRNRADAYIAKPFDMNVLLAKTENVLEQVKERQKALSEHADGDGGKQEGIQITEIDREFLDKAIALIEGSLSDDGFGVDELAREIGMSRSVLYRKIRALTGMSIVEFLRHIRLDNAERLLKSGKYNVSEVMYMVGFSSLSYFSRAFKKEFGRLPTETSDRKPQK